MSETEAAADAEETAEEPVVESTADAEPAVEEAPPEPADEEPEAAADEEPEAAADEDEEEDPAIAAAEAELAEEAIPVPVGPAAGRHAKVFLCDRGHRTVAVWSQPTSCHARPTRSGGECGRPLYPISDLPEQVLKALNPLKASKKGSRG
jgi:hypothetical protein